MPFTQAKVTFIFKDKSSGRGGWTENLYVAATTAAGAFTPAMTRLINARIGILSPDYLLQKVRAASVPPYAPDNPRGRTSVSNLTIGQGTGMFPTTDRDPLDNSEQPVDCVVIRAEGGLSRRTVTIRGLPTEIIRHVLGYDPHGDWITPFNTWRNAYKAIGQIRRRQLSAYASILSVQVNTDNRSLILTFDSAQIGVMQPPPFATGSLILLSDIIGSPNINAIWRVKATPSPIVLKTWPKQVNISGGTYTGGYARQITYTYDPMTSVEAVTGSSRDTGRPLDVLRGRPSRRRT